MRVGILTISDRAARGEYEDRSGPLLREVIEDQGWDVIRFDVVSDDQAEIEEHLKRWADSSDVDLILTAGGTGFSPRDRAPEATLAVIDRLTPGLVEAMRAASMSVTPHAMLSRAVAGIRRKTLIVNLPGSPRAVEENLTVILPALPHGVDLLKDHPSAEAGHTLRQPHPED